MHQFKERAALRAAGDSPTPTCRVAVPEGSCEAVRTGAQPRKHWICARTAVLVPLRLTGAQCVRRALVEYEIEASR